MSRIIRTFPNEPVPPYITHGEGLYLFTEDGRKLLDTTSGYTASAILGYSEPRILDAMRKQMEKICYIDYKIWSDRNRDELAELLLSKAQHKLNRVYYAGNSGSEACEAAMKMSYQVHYDLGKKTKTWFISRMQSYHGATSDALALGERPNLTFFEPMLSMKRAKIPQHHPKLEMKPGETLDLYAKRSAKELEDKILELGPENVCGFIGETIMGGLVGDVPPAPNYWKYINEVCKKYDVHLILDEVWCGTGTSGKIYCCDWDDVTPDFIFLGKTLAASYCPISVVITSNKVEEIIVKGQGRVQHGHTHQGHALGVAAALAAQKIIHNDDFLENVNKLGEHIQNRLRSEIGTHEFFFDARGRGLRQTMEYQCENKNAFGIKLYEIMEREHGILISGKWHRVSFTPALTIDRDTLDFVLDKFIGTFKKVAAEWTSERAAKFAAQ